MRKKDLIPSLLIILLGTIDCVTTVIGIMYSGAKELNPFMAGIVNSNMGTFLVIKTAGTLFIALTYVLARHLLLQMPDKSGKTFSYSFKFIRFAYAGVIAFLFIVVANNLIILFA